MGSVRAFRVTVGAHVMIVPARTASKAKFVAWRSSNEYSRPTKFGEISARRAPEYDRWATGAGVKAQCWTLEAVSQFAEPAKRSLQARYDELLAAAKAAAASLDPGPSKYQALGAAARLREVLQGLQGVTQVSPGGQGEASAMPGQA